VGSQTAHHCPLFGEAKNRREKDREFKGDLQEKKGPASSSFMSATLIAVDLRNDNAIESCMYIRMYHDDSVRGWDGNLVRRRAVIFVQWYLFWRSGHPHPHGEKTWYIHT
jgi:hypothetical protein